jgi:hypothetical protein
MQQRNRIVLITTLFCLLVSACGSMQRRPMMGGGGRRPPNPNAQKQNLFDRDNQNEEDRRREEEEFQRLLGQSGVLNGGVDPIAAAGGLRPSDVEAAGLPSLQGDVFLNDRFGNVATRGLASDFSNERFNDNQDILDEFDANGNPIAIDSLNGTHGGVGVFNGGRQRIIRRRAD